MLEAHVRKLDLSSAQRRLWFLQKVDDQSTAYHLTSGWRCRGPLDDGALKAAFDAVIRRHETLRCVFLEENGEPYQVVRDEWTIRIPLIHLPEAELTAFCRAEGAKPFDLQAEPAIRASLVRLADDDHVVHIVVHHIIADGRSLDVLKREVAHFYEFFTGYERRPPPPLRASYQDVIEEERRRAVAATNGLAYWSEQLADLAILELRTDRPRPNTPPHDAERVAFRLSAELTENLKNAARREGLTLFMVLLTAYAVMLSRWTGQADIAVGTPISQGARHEFDDLIGLLLNELVLRIDLSGHPDLRELFLRVRTVCLAAYAHQDVPFDDVIKAVNPRRDLVRSPLFQVSFAFQSRTSSAPPRRTIGDLVMKPFAVGAPGAQGDLLLSAWEREGAVAGYFCYPIDLFDHTTVQRMARHWQTLLERIGESETCRLDDLDMSSEDEREQVVYGWNQTAQPYRDDVCVHEVIEEQAAHHADAVAVIGEDAHLTYDALNRRANGVAHRLRALGVGTDRRVGLCVERGLDMMIGLLGVLKAGGAYVPLDPSYPVDRLRALVADSAPAALLVGRHLHTVFAPVADAIAVLDVAEAGRAESTAWASNLTRAEVGVGPRDVAYVLYTSGSTGLPKGVLVEHRSIVNRLAWMQRAYPLTAEDTVLQKTPFSFDVSVWELFWPLLEGRPLVLARPDGHKDPAYLVAAIARHRVTRTHFVPSMLPAFLDAVDGRSPWPALQVICSGEALSPALVQRFYERLPEAGLHNLYGPTEATVDVTAWPCPREVTGTSIPIGRPLANTQIYILDRGGLPAPVGVAGELCIGGVGVARGYLGRAALTAARFVPDPFGPVPGRRLYRTGDLARWRADGVIEFLGRADFQVKVRGFRIELGEIEARLTAHPAIAEAVVLARETAKDDTRLVAYYTTRGPGAELSVERVRAHVAATLPEYMVPAAYVRVEQWPLTPSGKLNRKALPAPDESAFDVAQYEAPQGELEQTLAAIWAELLHVDRVGRHDNFFALGGHSLLAVTLAERMRRRGFEVDVRAILAHPTVAGLAVVATAAASAVVAPPNRIPPGCTVITPDRLPLIALTQEEIARIVMHVPGGPANVQDIYPLAPLQEGILFHHLLAADGDPYLLANQLAFDSRARLARFLDALNAVIARHDILRTAVVRDDLPEPVQVVWRQAVLPVEEVVLPPAADGNDVARQLYDHVNPRTYRMDVREAPLIRAWIAPDPETDRWLLLLVLHHLAGDHTTLAAIQYEVGAHLAGEIETLPASQPFRDLVAQARLGVSRAEHEAFFREMLADVEQSTAPFGLLDVLGDGRDIDEARMYVDEQLGLRLRAQARRLGVSAASLCHLAWAQVVAKTSGRDDVVFGTVLFGRLQGGVAAEQGLGLFINTLPVRIRLADARVEASARRTHAALTELLRHEHAPLALAQRCSGVAAPAPLFTALLNYRYSGAAGVSMPAWHSSAWTGIEMLRGEERSNYPVTLSVDDWGERFELTAHVTEEIDATRICGFMHQALDVLVHALERGGDEHTGNLEVLPPAERKQVVYGWNQTAQAYRDDVCVHEVIEEQVAQHADAVAVIGEDAHLTYDALNRRANRVAHHLRALGVGTDRRVGLCVERGLDMMIGLLGVLKAGGAYVPLDPSYPVDRLRAMVADSAPAALLVGRHLHTVFATVADAIPLMDVAEAGGAGSPAGEANPTRAEVGVGPRDVAYVIYTSGSTGLPKGVMVEHRSIVNRLAWMQRAYALTAEDTVLQKTPFSFDVSVWELFWPLLEGRVLVLARPEGHKDPAYLVAAIARHRVTRTHFVPSMLSAFLDAVDGRSPWPALQVICSGEALSPALVQRFYERLPEARLHNLYGPTEATVDVTAWPCPRDVTGTSIPIGRPLANTQIYILDRGGLPAPVGVAGELCIGGVGVARGYLGRAALTAARFVPDPFGPEPGRRLYRTGDLARWRSDGTIEFLGRADFQVKVRGFRIELGEIEARLTAHPAIADPVVITRETPEGTQLVAYVRTRDAAAVSAEALRAHVAATLPKYMIPAAFVRVEQWPLTPSGKLNRKALPEPDDTAFGVAQYEAPQSEAEHTLAALWAELLHVDRVGRHDNFFALGGHSLLAVTLAERMQRHGFEVDVRAIFAHPTVAGLAVEQVEESRL